MFARLRYGGEWGEMLKKGDKILGKRNQVQYK